MMSFNLRLLNLIYYVNIAVSVLRCYVYVLECSKYWIQVSKFFATSYSHKGIQPVFTVSEPMKRHKLTAEVEAERRLYQPPSSGPR